jgi:prepilin peptidase CpaA
MDPSADKFLLSFLSVVLISAAITDMRVRKIPNMLTFSLLMASLVYYGMSDGIRGLYFSAGGCIVGFAIFIIPYFMGRMGAGDVKLMGAVGSVVGAKGAVIAILFTACVGGFQALVLLGMNRKYARDLIMRGRSNLKAFAVTGRIVTVPASENIRKPRLPYGVAIAVGTLSYIYFELSGYQFIAL